MSQPARAVWIEIVKGNRQGMKGLSHSLRGLCGLKFHINITVWGMILCHSLRGLCGLK